jgi:hypothetical protein
LGAKSRGGDARELIDRGLAHGVGGDPRKRPQARDARDIDDRTAALDERRRRFPDQPERRANVDVHHRVPALVSRVSDAA